MASTCEGAGTQTKGCALSGVAGSHTFAGGSRRGVF